MDINDIITHIRTIIRIPGMSSMEKTQRIWKYIEDIERGAPHGKTLPPKQRPPKNALDTREATERTMYEGY